LGPELTLRSGEIRGLVWDSIDLESKRLFVEHQATRRREDDTTKSENALRTVPVPGYLIPELKRWKLACPPTARGFVFPGEPNAQGERGPIEADILLRHILRRALRRAGLPPLRFHDMRHLAGTLMSEAGVPPKRAQEILGRGRAHDPRCLYARDAPQARRLGRQDGRARGADELGKQSGNNRLRRVSGREAK
jgi:integrase